MTGRQPLCDLAEIDPDTPVRIEVGAEPSAVETGRTAIDPGEAR